MKLLTTRLSCRKRMMVVLSLPRMSLLLGGVMKLRVSFQQQITIHHYLEVTTSMDQRGVLDPGFHMNDIE